MFSNNQIKTLRNIFRIVNRFMVFMWRIGLGKFINIWPAVGGRIMVIRHTGRKTGKERLMPVNYAIADGEIYCTAGFGANSDWYRNITARPLVELWLPDGKYPALAQDITDSPQRLFLLRQVLIASGFAASLFANMNPRKMTDEKLAAATSTYRLIHFKREK